jgi:hypothetical protein
MQTRDTRRAPLPRTRKSHQADLITLAAFLTVALVVVPMVALPPTSNHGPFSFLQRESGVPPARPSDDAFGLSGEVKLRLALPGESIQFPLLIGAFEDSIFYGWIRVGATKPEPFSRFLDGASLVAPPSPGFYHLVLTRGSAQRAVNGITVAVLRPFEEKVGGILNGYQIGTYLAERNRAAASEPPRGFLEITPSDVDIQITRHLKVGDFLTHDDQTTWPKYAAVSPHLLDKLELVLAEVVRIQAKNADTRILIEVRSGFRSPAHNRQVWHAARDSHHQYGEAADVAIDANGDGRFTALDSKVLGVVVEMIETRHPELSGGLGVYVNRAGRPYVHIDVRGRRVRWWG